MVFIPSSMFFSRELSPNYQLNQDDNDVKAHTLGPTTRYLSAVFGAIKKLILEFWHLYKSFNRQHAV